MLAVLARLNLVLQLSRPHKQSYTTCCALQAQFAQVRGQCPRTSAFPESQCCLQESGDQTEPEGVVNVHQLLEREGPAPSIVRN